MAQSNHGADSAVLDTAGGGGTTDQEVIGAIAAGAALTKAPVTTGGLAKTALPTAVDDADVVNAMHNKYGMAIVRAGLRELLGRQVTTITSSTAETTIVTADADELLDIYRLTIANTSATACVVTIKDATAGTTVWVWAVPAGQSVGFSGPLDAAEPQSAVNNNWTATCGTSVASIVITASYIKNK
jgi:hypothetical protein